MIDILRLEEAVSFPIASAHHIELSPNLGSDIVLCSSITSREGVSFHDLWHVSSFVGNEPLAVPISSMLAVTTLNTSRTTLQDDNFYMSAGVSILLVLTDDGNLVREDTDAALWRSRRPAISPNADPHTYKCDVGREPTQWSAEG